MVSRLFAVSYFFGRVARRCATSRVRVVVLLACCVSAPSSLAGPGAEMYNEFLEKGVIYPDQAWQDYVTEVGERLLAQSPHAGRTYTFVVVDQPVVNAWATPDAYIFVTRGILAFFNSEDELAAVLGHEIGHVVGEHSRSAVGKQRLGKVLGIVGAFATGSASTISLANAVTQTAIAGYGRKQELEADEFGAEVVLKTGYNPTALLDSIQMLRDHDNYQKAVNNRPTIYHGMLGSHPAHQKRLYELVRKSQHLAPEQLNEPLRDFHQMLSGLRFGDDDATGVVKDGVYYHGALRLRIAFPKDWDIRATASEVFAKNNQNSARLNVRKTALPSEAQTPEEYLTETLKRDDLLDGEAIQVGGYSGYVASIELTDDKKASRKIAVLYKDGGVYVFNGEVDKPGSPEQFEKIFLDMVSSTRAMTAEDMRLINKQQLHIVMANPGDTYAKLARTVPIKQNAEELLRVMNGHHPNGEPRAGDLIKLVR